jgi:acyl dehydratase
MALGPYRVQAYNTSKASENKIHDDETARRFGFTGGLVGGVNVWAYMSHLPVERWGPAWLERGTGACRFGKPVYDGETAEVSGEENADGLELRVTSRGELCATGRATLPAAAQAVQLDAYQPVPAQAQRPAADEQSLAVGTWLGMQPLLVTPEYQAQDLKDTRETAGLYAAERIVHPGTILRCANWALSHNVVLPAWMHVGSTLHNLGVARVGDTLGIRARVTRNYEHKGHKFVEIDGVVTANGDRAVAHVVHAAIYRPRQLAAAA